MSYVVCTIQLIGTTTHLDRRTKFSVTSQTFQDKLSGAKVQVKLTWSLKLIISRYLFYSNSFRDPL